MTELVSWPRSRFQAGGGDALIYFEVCGKFDQIPAVSTLKHNSAGVPAGVEVFLDDNDFSRWEGPLFELLLESNREVATAVREAPQVLSIRGEVADPASLDYLRDVTGLVMAALENGGAGVVAPQMLEVFSPAQWRESFFQPIMFEPTNHTVILASMEPNHGGTWLHTRGMRIYGRPDISCHFVKAEEMQPMQSIFNGLIRMQAAGAMLPEGQPVQAVGLDGTLFCRHKGDLEDPEFNNLHLELEWEQPRNA